MKNKLIKILSLALCLATVLSLFSLSISAGDPAYVPVEWSMDKDARHLYGNDKCYDRYYANGKFYGDAETRFYFMNTFPFDGYLCDIYGDSWDPHIVRVVYDGSTAFVFADSEGKKILNNLLTGKDCYYYLEFFEDGRSTKYTPLTDTFVDSLESAYFSNSNWIKQVNAADLAEGEILEITAHDRLGMCARQQGAIYRMPNGVYYYVCFEGLEKKFFDDSGFFAYRSRTVDALQLNQVFCKQVDQVADQLTDKPSARIIYEEDVVDGFVDKYGNSLVVDPLDDLPNDVNFSLIVVFFIFFIFIGLICPIPFFVLGLVLGFRRKCWFGLSVSAGCWFFFSLLLCVFLVLL